MLFETPEQQDERFMRIALQEASQAAEEGEIPVGAVIVQDGQLIARAHNMTERLRDVTAHAEMQAMSHVCRSNRLGTSAACGMGHFRLQAGLFHTHSNHRRTESAPSQGHRHLRHPGGGLPLADYRLLPQPKALEISSYENEKSMDRGHTATHLAGEHSRSNSGNSLRGTFRTYLLAPGWTLSALRPALPDSIQLCKRIF